MRIAELGRTGPTLVALSLASLGLLFVPGSNTTDEPVEPVKVERTPEPRSCFRPPPAPCPTAVRAQAGLDQSANIACVQANVGESAWFVFGHYKTTEAWERIGVVSGDGARVLVPFVDRPSRANQGAKLLTYLTADLNGDGRAEAIGTWTTGSTMRHEVFTVAGNELRFAISTDQPQEMLEPRSPCKLRVRGAEVLVDNDRSCSIEHGVRWANSRFIRLY